MSDESDRVLGHPVSLPVVGLSQPQRDLLWMRLRGDGVPFEFDGEMVSVPGVRADDLDEALRWVTEDLVPMETNYATPRPFRRVLADGTVVASRWKRLLGWLVDSVLVSPLYLVARVLDVSGLFSYALIGLYVICFTHWFGGTAGKLIVGVRVIDANDGGRSGWRGAAIRWLVTASPVLAAALVGPNRIVQLFLFVVEIAIYLPIVWDPFGQGLHDRLAQTIVVRHRAHADRDEAGEQIR
jgi:uncharacterized RDD family membrane protein YckC